MKKGRQIFLRKFLAVFLSISMIFGLLPGNLMVALAEDREEKHNDYRICRRISGL